MPLTGEVVEDASVLDRPVVAVKIENSAAARPQSGLEAADIVFEEITEGGVTRFLSLFQSDVPELVGPVRSGRPEDSDILPAYNALLFISGARPDVLDGLRAAGVTFREEDGEVLFRDRSRNAPHNLYARGEALFEAAADAVPAADPVPWEFSEEPPDGAVACPEPCENDPGRSIEVAMSAQSRSGFTYDEDAGVYRREHNGTPLSVTGSGRIGAANVLVLASEIVQAGCCDPSGNPLNATEIVGTGRALLLRDGRVYVGQWVKATPDSHILVTGAAGQPLVFKPGPTWAMFAPERGVPTVDASPGAG
ncbi:MAG: DUF3048 domain-containing protein [Actinobacteria bacterium]|nr:DUF3048 domain-containing protein [Actinomycetota bacterium]